MLQMFRLKQGQKDLPEKINALYIRAFPGNERVNFSYFAYDPCELLYFMEDDHLVGFMTTMSSRRFTHITYFAIEEADREKGYGSECLTLIRKRYSDHVILADLEMPEENAENESQRLSRVHFYEKNGFHKTEVAYRWENEDYRIYTCNGTITDHEFKEFWEEMYKSR